MSPIYEYRATVIRVIDGDTLHLDVDLGCDVHTRMTVRLYGVNCPEKNTPEGVLARDFVARWATGAFLQVTLQTVKDKREKYGRYLARIYDTGGECLNDILVDAGHAVRKEYR